jgi:hypothetical protein
MHVNEALVVDILLAVMKMRVYNFIWIENFARRIFYKPKYIKLET